MTKTSTCADCATPFTFEPITFGNKVVFSPTKCDTCTEKSVAYAEQDALKRRENARRDRFKQMIPPIYIDTIAERIPARLREATEMWEYNPMGLGFIGMSGRCKTRSAVLLLERMHDEGRTTFYISSTDLALNSANQFADNPATKSIAVSILTMCRSCEVLLLDDLGKGRMTDRAESELYDLLEYRTSRRLPTIWTSNSDASALHGMFSQDRATAILRRLKEFSQIVKA